VRRTTVGCGVRRAYTFRLRPTARQQVALGQCLASHRELYNAALQERRDAWRLRRTTVSYGDQSAQLRAIREAWADVKAWSFSSQQATLRRLYRAFAGFFRRVNVGQTPGYPRFKPAHRFDSVEWPKDGDGCRWHADTRKVYLQGIGPVKVTVHRQVEGRVKTIQVRRHHHAARALVGDYGLLVVEDLKIRNMMRRPAPRPDPDHPGRFLPNGAATKTGLHRSIHDVDARHTSDRCGACGHTAKENRASQAVFACRSCGHTLNADEHAARNILRAGLARLAADPAA
jgi:transposase